MAKTLILRVRVIKRRALHVRFVRTMRPIGKSGAHSPYPNDTRETKRRGSSVIGSMNASERATSCNGAVKSS